MTVETGPVTIIIFGITGDLAKRKLLPALYHLTRNNLLHPDTKVIGVTRQDISANDALKPLEKYTASHARPSLAALERFRRNFSLYKMDLSAHTDYDRLKKHLSNTGKREKFPPQVLYYLSIPPSVLDEVMILMGKAGLQKGTPSPAVLIEKPFGYDLKSAKDLIRSINLSFKESQVYRIDHYLAKEMAQNIVDFRFRNPLFEAVWNKQHIKSVVITAHETIGIEGRTAFYEQTGALRDLIQSHLLQLMSLTAMERPHTLNDARQLRQRRLQLLRSIKTPEPYQIAKTTLRGQYSGYRKEVNNTDSNIETYAAVRLHVDNQRWTGVPFVLRTGKALGERSTRIDVQFKDNVMTFSLQPDEGIALQLTVKEPGHRHRITQTAMDFSYHRTFPGIDRPEAYERVLLDAIRQDQTLFASSQEILRQWQIIEPILNEWNKAGKPIAYRKGSFGPMNAQRLHTLLRPNRGG